MNKKLYAMVLASVTELVVLVLGLVYAGRWVDEKYNLPGYAMTAGGFLAMFLWGFHLMIIFKKVNQDEGDSGTNKN